MSDNQWIQASLPVRSGGLEIRRLSSLATPAFLASAVGTKDLQSQILRAFDFLEPNNDLAANQQAWSELFGAIPHSVPLTKQQTQDKPIINAELSQLFARQIDNYGKADY